MLSNLLIYRWLLCNGLGISLAVSLALSGHLIPIIQGGAPITYAILALFGVGWVWTIKEVVFASLDLNWAKQHGPRQGHPAQADKDAEKVEWLSSVAEWLVGLGLLGTVWGFYIALSGVDQNTVSQATGAQAAVAALMQGMRVALTTTLLGAGLAMWHEVNVRLLRTGLTVLWADRIVARDEGREPEE